MLLDVHSTRLFPKGEGPKNYRLTGIAGMCDTVVCSDVNTRECAILGKDPDDAPDTVFLSLRHPFVAIMYFADHVLPRLQHPFVLISGSEDVTIPNQTDQRWRPYNKPERAAIARILDHPHLLHWTVENLDDASHAKLRPLPLGHVGGGEDKVPAQVEVPFAPPLQYRPLRAFLAHRVRQHAQWDLRRNVSAIAQQHWSGFCSIFGHEMPEADFMLYLRAHAFAICVEGGGLDPSPKAWQALMHGCVPIIRRTALAPAYAQLPVAFVDEWTPDAINPARLQAWREEFAPYFANATARQKVLHRLSLTYWWEYATCRQDPVIASGATANQMGTPGQ